MDYDDHNIFIKSKEESGVAANFTFSWVNLNHAPKNVSQSTGVSISVIFLIGVISTQGNSFILNQNLMPNSDNTVSHFSYASLIKCKIIQKRNRIF